MSISLEHLFGPLQYCFMPQLLNGKTALILGVANRWSLAFAIAQAYVREGAKVILTYQGERQQRTLEDLAKELGGLEIVACDVSKDAELTALAAKLTADGVTLNAVVHPIAFDNR